jgi:transcriptional regulator GlxA family with amidase domain
LLGFGSDEFPIGIWEIQNIGSAGIVTRKCRLKTGGSEMSNDNPRESFIPKGATSLQIEFDGPPKDFYFLLLPKMTMLAFSAAVEPLRIANQVAKKELYRWFTMTENGTSIQCSNFVTILPDTALQTVPKGAYAFVCSGIEPTDAATQTTINWLNRQRAFGASIGGICTGAFALAQAGLLTNRAFTLHWENQPSFSEHFPELHPTSNIFENDGGLMTCGGGNAATDMMLSIIEADHGIELAIIVADMCIHSRSFQNASPQKSAHSVILGCRNQRLVNAIKFMEENLEEPVSMLEIGSHVATTRRQLERLFKQYTQLTPHQFYCDLRVSRAHSLLSETNLSVTEIAMATGFTSASQLSKHFRRKYNEAPHTLRKGWI